MIAPAHEAELQEFAPFRQEGLKGSALYQGAGTRETVYWFGNSGGPREARVVGVNCDFRQRDAMVPR